jgi:polyribonucleotide 5'-hydroxyl-kinase
MVSYLNLHLLLASQRAAAAVHGRMGPRVMVCGTANAGRTSLVRMLASWAVKMGKQCAVVNADPSEGMLSLPGTLTSAVFTTIMDVESDAGGWGTTPSSGPSTVPVKLPLVYYYGHDKAEANAALYKQLLSRLAGSVTRRMSEDPEVMASGMLIDAPTVALSGSLGIDLLAHIVEEFSGKSQGDSIHKGTYRLTLPKSTSSSSWDLRG